jgi:hypothetical protein
MAGINDIRTAFEQAVNGLRLKALRMKYADPRTGEQVFELDIVDANGERTIEERVPAGWMIPQITEALVKAAQALGAEVDMDAAKAATDAAQAELNKAPEPAADSQMAKLVGGDAIPEWTGEIKAVFPEGGLAQHIVSEPTVEIEHKGEKYALAADGSPETLFF